MEIPDHLEGNGKPLQYSCLENPMDGGAWWATYSPWGRKESDTTEWLQFTCLMRNLYAVQEETEPDMGQPMD